MSARLAAILQRRASLIERADQQRGDFAAGARRWRAPLAVVDMGIAVGRAVRANPALFAGATALLLYFPKARLAIWLGRAWSAWQLFRALRAQWPSTRTP